MLKKDREEFPYGKTFPVKITHKDGKDLADTKHCYFDCETNAQKYITKNNFKKKDYTIKILKNE